MANDKLSYSRLDISLEEGCERIQQTLNQTSLIRNAVTNEAGFDVELLSTMESVK